MPRKLVVVLTICSTICIASAANAACIDLKQKDPLSFQGILNYRIFPGPPNYEDVRKGDTPEPTYTQAPRTNLRHRRRVCRPKHQVRSNSNISRVGQSRSGVMARSSRVHRATRPCCGHWGIRTPNRTSPCSPDAAHSEHFSRFRPDKVSRYVHDHGSRFLLGAERRQR